MLTADPDYWGIGDHLSWSADGGLLSFSASGPFQSHPGGAFGSGWPLLAIAKTEGGDSRVYPDAFLNGGDPVMAPDGGSAVFSRMKLVKTLPGGENYLFKTSIWSLNVGSGSVKRLTRWRLKSYLEPISYSTVGPSLVAEFFGRGGARIVSVDLRNGHTAPLARLPEDAEEPTYSPDGTRLAFVRDKTLRGQLPKPDRPRGELLGGERGRQRRRATAEQEGLYLLPELGPFREPPRLYPQPARRSDR